MHEDEPDPHGVDIHLKDGGKVPLLPLAIGILVAAVAIYALWSFFFTK